jgi:hypothetical protein
VIFVRIYPSDEKFTIELQHKIKYVVEKKFGKTKSLDRRTFYVFAQLLFATIMLISKEVFMRPRK